MTGCHKPLCSGAESRRRTTQMGKSSNKAAAGSGLYVIEQGEEDRQPSNQSRRGFFWQYACSFYGILPQKAVLERGM